MTLTTTPVVKAQNGRRPMLARRENRVLRPMLKKQKINAQVRSAVIGAIKAGVRVVWYSARV